MEPMTAISLIAGSATLAKAAGSAVVGLCDLRSRYGSAPRTVDLLIAQINVLEEAMMEISLWLDTTPAILGKSTTFGSRLRISVDACQHLIKDIDEHTARVKESSDFSGRVRQIWKEGQIREWEHLLNSQVLALQLLIDVSKLRSSSEQQSMLDKESSRRILTRAKDDASSYCRPQDTERDQSEVDTTPSNTTSYHTHFAFDRECLISKPYRRVSEALHRRPDTASQVASLGSASPILSPTEEVVLLSNNYDAAVPILAGDNIQSPTIMDGDGTMNITSSKDMARPPSIYAKQDNHETMPISCAALTTLQYGQAGRKGKEVVKPVQDFAVTTSSTGIESPPSHANRSSIFTSLDDSVSVSHQPTPLTTMSSADEDEKEKSSAEVPPRWQDGGVLVVVEINDIGNAQQSINVSNGNQYSLVSRTIEALRDQILREAHLEPSSFESTSVTRTISASSSEGVVKFPLTPQFLIAALEQVESTFYSEVTAHARFAALPDNLRMGNVQHILHQQLLDATIQGPDGDFVPPGKLQEIFTTESLMALFNECQSEVRTNMGFVHEVCLHGRKLLAACLLANVQPLFATFISFWDNSFRDATMPFVSSTCPPFCTPAIYHELCAVQWRFLAVDFEDVEASKPFPTYRRNQVLPFIEQKCIGRGGYGIVWKVTLADCYTTQFRTEFNLGNDTTTIALKQLTKKGNKSREIFQRESEILKMLAKLESPHIVSLLGGFSRADNFYLLFPLASFSLKDMLRYNPRNYQRDSHFLRWVHHQVLGIATALNCIHSPPTKDTHSNPLVCCHLDLKPDNILIFHNIKNSTEDEKSLGVWKIADFGVSCLKSPSAEPQTMTNFRGTPHYAAPECDLLNPPERRMQEQAYDIWSFGCILVEVLAFVYTGTEGIRTFEEARSYNTAGSAVNGPYSRFYTYSNEAFQVSPSVLWIIQELHTVCDAVWPGYDDRNRVRKLLDLALDCLQVDPNKRLKASHLIQRLENISITTPSHNSKLKSWNPSNDIPETIEPLD